MAAARRDDDFPKNIPFPKPPSTLSLAEPPLRLTEPLAGGFKFKFQLEVQLRLTIRHTQLFTMSESSSNKYYKTQKLRPEPRPRLSHDGIASVRVKVKRIHRESPRCAPGTLLMQCRLHKTKKHTVAKKQERERERERFIRKQCP